MAERAAALGTALEVLWNTVEARAQAADTETSYTARLLAGGLGRVAQKVGEEATETVIAAVQAKRDSVVSESADLLYHILVLWQATGVKPDEVAAELMRRAQKRSGNPRSSRDRAAAPPTGRNGLMNGTEGAYDDTNVFARILRGEFPCDKVFEDEHTLAFRDIQPQTRVHILVIPKGRYVSMADFSSHANGPEILSLVRAIGRVARDAGVEEAGYRFLSNHGEHAYQEVPHFHVHVFGGQPLGRMIKPPTR